MSLLGRLFGGRSGGAAAPVPIPDDLVAALTADGTPLPVAVETVLRAHVAAGAQPPAEAQVTEAPAEMPFWVSRDRGQPGDMEEELRDRVIQRHSTETDKG